MSGKNPFYGATFAERKAIREGRTIPEPEADEPESTEAKQVDAEAAENKAITAAATKRQPRRKKS